MFRIMYLRTIFFQQNIVKWSVDGYAITVDYELKIEYRWGWEMGLSKYTIPIYPYLKTLEIIKMKEL